MRSFVRAVPLLLAACPSPAVPNGDGVGRSSDPPRAELPASASASASLPAEPAWTLSSARPSSPVPPRSDAWKPAKCRLEGGVTIPAAGVLGHLAFGKAGGLGLVHIHDNTKTGELIVIELDAEGRLVGTAAKREIFTQVVWPSGLAALDDGFVAVGKSLEEGDVLVRWLDRSGKPRGGELVIDALETFVRSEVEVSPGYGDVVHVIGYDRGGWGSATPSKDVLWIELQVNGERIQSRKVTKLAGVDGSKLVPWDATGAPSFQLDDGPATLLVGRGRDRSTWVEGRRVPWTFEQHGVPVTVRWHDGGLLGQLEKIGNEGIRVSVEHWRPAEGSKPRPERTVAGTLAPSGLGPIVLRQPPSSGRLDALEVAGTAAVGLVARAYSGAHWVVITSEATTRRLSRLVCE